MKLTIHVDANTYQTNPGPCAVGVVIEADNRLLVRHGLYIGRCTNNVGEWRAVIEGIKAARNLAEWDQAAAILLCSDSQLVVNQATGRYKIKSPHLQPLADQVAKLIDEAPMRVHIEWNPRDLSEDAHNVSIEALEEAMARLE